MKWKFPFLSRNLQYSLLILPLIIILHSQNICANKSPDSFVFQKTSLSFEDRVNCQKAIEKIFWEHRVWPKDNPHPKPSF
ncbi:MAG: hypothetical protein A2Y62_05355 [Candidatus Fischerbacteria bacterium RBG_13_37_8]|uniref:Uncharacterized protein n=1 Tax=Candidatus Fischerbacteria bacterium RBG_13_37_8 TaxID=1817863 RepID=A0A1F5VXM9_9BACT|nr:MAG: hypothetical protein A2Y62_05355 [Candidatus Fischerbacteria bacterium RBG_13_37_8]